MSQVVLTTDSKTVHHHHDEGKYRQGSGYPNIGRGRSTQMQAHERRQGGYGKDSQQVDGKDKEKDRPNVFDESVGVFLKEWSSYFVPEVGAESFQ